MSSEKTSWVRHILTFILIFGAGGFIMYRGGCQSTPQGGPPDNARTVDVSVDKWVVTAEVADTKKLRRQGLSGRRELTPGYGMLFVFPQPEKADFWMKNTTIPLSIAFIKPDGTVVDIQQMAPESLRRHVAPEPVKYALEVRQGWFEDRKLQPPFKVELPNEIPPPRTNNNDPTNQGE